MADADGPGRTCAAPIAGALPLARVHTPEREGEDARDVLGRMGPVAFGVLLMATTNR